MIVSAIAAYLGSAETVPLSQRVAELETKVKELQVLLKARFIGGAND